MAQDSYQDSIGENGTLSGGTVTLAGAIAGFSTFASHTPTNTIPVRVIQVTDGEITKGANYAATYSSGSLALGTATTVSALGEPTSGAVEVYEVAAAADLNKAASALQSSDIGASVQAYSAVLAATTASFTTALKTKLDGIEAGATADQDADEVSVTATPSNYTAATADVEAHLAGIDTALAGGSGATPVLWVQTDGTSQSISNATFTALHGGTGGVLRTTHFDANSDWTASTGRFTPSVAGVYRFTAYAVAAGLNSGKRIIATVMKNGSSRGDMFRQYSAATDGYPGGSGVIYWDMNGSTDYIELQAYQDSGGTLGIPDAWLFAEFLGELV